MKRKILIVGSDYDIIKNKIIEQLSSTYIISGYDKYIDPRRMTKYDILMSWNKNNRGNYQDGWYQKHNNKNRHQR